MAAVAPPKSVSGPGTARRQPRIGRETTLRDGLAAAMAIADNDARANALVALAPLLPEAEREPLCVTRSAMAVSHDDAGDGLFRRWPDPNISSIFLLSRDSYDGAILGVLISSNVYTSWVATLFCYLV
jgi:hypothetical protein